MKKRNVELIDNKMALLKERSCIVDDLQKRGFHFFIKDYAGSNVMSCFELIIKIFFCTERDKKYIQNPFVKESINILLFTEKNSGRSILH